MSTSEPEEITLAEYRRLIRKQGKIRLPQKKKRNPPLKCSKCGKRIPGTESCHFRIEGTKAIPYHFWCYHQRKD